MKYIGFDMGDGESAVAVFQQGSGIEPIIQPILGSRSLISAVGMLKRGSRHWRTGLYQHAFRGPIRTL